MAVDRGGVAASKFHRPQNLALIHGRPERDHVYEEHAHRPFHRMNDRERSVNGPHQRHESPAPGRSAAGGRRYRVLGALIASVLTPITLRGSVP